MTFQVSRCRSSQPLAAPCKDQQSSKIWYPPCSWLHTNWCKSSRTALATLNNFVSSRIKKNIQDSPFSSMGWGQLATASLKVSLPKHVRSKPGSHLEPGWDFVPVRHLSNQVLDLLQQVLIFNLESWDVTGRPGHKRSLKFNCTNTTKYKVQCKQH